MDLLLEARDTLAQVVRPQAPPGYRARLGAEIALCALLVLQTALYLCMWIRDTRARGKSIKLVRLQKTSGGRMISVQSLFAWTVFKAITAIMSLAYCCYDYNMYFNGGLREHQSFLTVATYWPTLMGAVAYTFPHLNTTLMLWRSSANKDTFSRRWVLTYNSALTGAALIITGTVWPIGWSGAAKFKALLERGTPTLALLESIISDPSTLTLDKLQWLQTSQGELLRLFASVKPFYEAEVAVVVIFCTIFAIAGICGIWMTHLLRKQSQSIHNSLYKSSGSMTLQTLPTAQGIDVSRVEDAPCNWGSPQGLNTNNTAILNSASSVPQYYLQDGRDVPLPQSVFPPEPQHLVLKPLRETNPETLALERMVRDLTLSVPLMLLLTLYSAICAGLCILFFPRTEWKYLEFKNDFLIWPECIISNIILAYFIYNHWYNPGKHGASNSNVTGNHSSLSRHARGFPAAQASNWQGTIAIDTLSLEAEHEKPSLKDGISV